MEAIKSRKKFTQIINYLKWRLVSIILFVFVLILTLSFRKENNRLYIVDNKVFNKQQFSVEITEINPYRLGPTVRLSVEGLFLYYNNLKGKGCKYYFIDYSNLNYSKIEEFNNFITRNDLLNFTISSGYVLDDWPTQISIIDKGKLNIIHYYGACYNEKLDSLIGYMNSFIPKKQSKDFKIKTHEIGLRMDCR